MTSPNEPSHRDTEHEAIQRLLITLSEAWNAGDADAYGELFTEDATYVTFFGQILRGRPEIAAAHRWLFARIRGSRMPAGVKSQQEISFLSPEVALIIGTGGGTALPSQEPTDDRASTVSFVAVRRGTSWRFAHFQNTHVAPMPHLAEALR